MREYQGSKRHIGVCRVVVLELFSTCDATVTLLAYRAAKTPLAPTLAVPQGKGLAYRRGQSRAECDMFMANTVCLGP